MENKKDQNIFLPYGCCKSPKPYGKNEDVFDHGCAKLDVHDWLKDINSYHNSRDSQVVEIRFKNSRKDFFISPMEFNLIEGDIVAVESSPGHDIGIVSMAGQLVYLQMKKKQVDPRNYEFKKVYRKARSSDIEKWVSATSLEDSTLFKTRKIAKDLGLDMKVNDVEYQGDKTKAIFYYTAEDRVDFRELIKVLAETFNIRIEMKQIGVRQEAARLGGIGSCGRELCCGTWLTNFRSVSTNTARGQQLSLNPQKLAGQCGKLKCCLNFEHDCYVDAQKDFPDLNIPLYTKKGKAIYHKSDVHKGILWYSYLDDSPGQIPILVKDVHKIIKMNQRKKQPTQLEDFEAVIETNNQSDHLPEHEQFLKFE